MSDRQQGIIAWFTRHGVAANLLMLALVIGGLIAANGLRKEMFPQLELPYISVRVDYPGAAPQEVEEGIILKIEDAIEDIEGIKEVTSKANEGSAAVTIEVDEAYDTSEVLNEVKIRIDAISSLPEEAEKPVIYEIRPQQEVMWVQVYGDLDPRALKEYTRQIADELKDLQPITRADMEGSLDYEVSIEVGEHALRKYGLTLDEVANMVRRQSVDLPGGEIKADSGNIALRTKGKAYRGYQFDNLTVLTRTDGTRVLLKDIANVNDGFVDEDAYMNFDGKRSLAIGVLSVGDQDALKIAAAVKKYVKEKQATLPDGVKLAYWADISRLLDARLDMMYGNMLMGGVLVLLVLSLFLQVRLAFWVMMGLPVCFLGTLLVMHTPLLDVTINMISLFGFLLVLGIMVDDAIVVGESVHSEIEEQGPGVESVIAGAKKVAMPATFGVLTTVAAFVPLLLVTGPMGAIFQTMGSVVVLCLLFSLVESKLILPAHLKHIRITDRPTRNPLTRFKKAFNRQFNRFVTGGYQPFLQRCLRFRYLTVASFIALMLLIFGLLNGGLVRYVFFPDIPSDFIHGSLEMVSGTPSAQTKASIQHIERAVNRVDQQWADAHQGERPVRHVMVWLNSNTSGEFVVELVGSESRSLSSFEFTKLLRKQIGQLVGVKTLKINSTINNSNSGGAIAFTLHGRNLDDLNSATAELKAALAKFQGVYDIEDSQSSDNLEVRLHLKPAAAALGLQWDDLARQVREGFYGAEVQRLQRDDEEVKVMVRYPAAQRKSLQDLQNMRIRTAAGTAVPFADVADIELGNGYSQITRVNEQRAVTIQAAADKAQIEPGEMTKTLLKDTIPQIEAHYPDVHFVLDGEAKDQQENSQQMLLGAVAALFVIYALLAVPLNSYSQPLIIMSVIPFGVIGAIFGHWLMGMSVSVLSLFGIIALSGVVVNDSLVMVDFVNTARRNGMAISEAVIGSGVKRFRPILLTSLTTFLGLMPILGETSMQAQLVIPMAISLAFGILFSTVITLLLVPALYLILDDVHHAISRYKAWLLQHHTASNSSETPEP